MRLNAGGVRELHWHKAAEWAYMIYGTRADHRGRRGGPRRSSDDVGVGDLWYFPQGIPHSIQGLGARRREFLLVFDDGNFNEDSTFLLSDWFKHMPPERAGEELRCAGVERSPTCPNPSELYIFPSPVPGPLADDRSPAPGRCPTRFSHRLLAQEPIRTKGGTVRIVRLRELPGLASTIAAALVEVEPGRHARAALASERGRVAVLHRRPGRA